ncbi:galactokinase [Carnobacteriaceae bacterium zg-84]|uniref:galactokinase n=1 Tax=Granulicatella sp. zg-84 TaxID=2678503 RepID=UPI0013C0EB63|nr:galactokinase [Granulicatella sp. zg-84]NEW65520.1 galactokinase [Granulicatella sp. zg-84]QMI85596.1 galactokinase [Carnobacteriaceae bacterium zg-84]
MFNTLESKFETLFHTKEHHNFFAPGRINLIGEHTDYNGGYVFPCAITLGTYAVASKREDTKLMLYSENFSADGVVECDSTDLTHSTTYTWTNYVKGMILYLKEAGYTIRTGANIVFYGNIPNGSGLSSSASFELLIGVIFKGLYQLDIEMIDLVKLGKKVENDFIGVQSGIMDQFAVGMGKENHAIRLDCQTLEYTLVPVDLKDNVIVIMNTNKRRELADSKYNERFNETRQALKELQTRVSIQTLADLTIDIFEANKDVLSSEVLVKRARHAVSENQRTIEATEKLRAGDLVGFGELMKQSHLSTELDYEVTGKELDTLVHTAWEQEGVIGARMTGAGFGGCAIAIVQKDKVDAFQQAVEDVYVKEIGYKPSFYIAEISNGAALKQ